MGNCPACVTSPQNEQPMGNIQIKKKGDLLERNDSEVSRYTPNPHKFKNRTNSTDRKVSPSPSPRPPVSRYVVVIHNYQARETTDLTITKGDRLQVLNDQGLDWWNVKHLGNGNVGLIPRNFVAEEKSLESEDWFFAGITHKEADHMLSAVEHQAGTFLVRPSEHNKKGFSLSLKCNDEKRGLCVIHYRIVPTEQGEYYLAEKQKFSTVQALISTYKVTPFKTDRILLRACPKPDPHLWDISPELCDRYEIDRTEIHLVRRLGHGNFGEVHYGKWRGEIEVAVKTLKPGAMSTEAFLEEAAIMKKFRNMNIVSLYAVCTKEEPMYIVQEYMCKGSLIDFLRRGEGRFLQFEDLLSIAAQVASGMKYIESKNLIHRDLAARNVLIGENNIAKICDFGLARVIEDDEYTPNQGKRFPIKWTAPEALNYHRFSIKSDVWSYGVFLMELFTKGQVPYPGMNNQELVQRLSVGYRMPRPVLVSPNIYEQMMDCWKENPEDRPTFERLQEIFNSFLVCTEGPYRDN